MQTNTKDTAVRDEELDEELAGILTAISIVSKRLARKLITLQKRDDQTGEGGKPDGKNG